VSHDKTGKWELRGGLDSPTEGWDIRSLAHKNSKEFQELRTQSFHIPACCFPSGQHTMHVVRVKLIPPCGDKERASGGLFTTFSECLQFKAAIFISPNQVQFPARVMNMRAL